MVALARPQLNCAVRTRARQPYLGMETVVEDDETLKLLVSPQGLHPGHSLRVWTTTVRVPYWQIKVLQGEFDIVTIEQVERRHGSQCFVADGLFAVPVAKRRATSLPPHVHRSSNASCVGRCCG